MRILVVVMMLWTAFVEGWGDAISSENTRGAVTSKNSLHRTFELEDDPLRNRGDPGQYFHDRIVEQRVHQSDHWRRMQLAQRSHLRGALRSALGMSEGGDIVYDEHHSTRERNVELVRAAAKACRETGRRCAELGVRDLGEGPGGKSLPWGNKRRAGEL
eukprot:Hpha_TRINITY_DN5745_c0_g1::TRINITY_DN5745_c0_g1_i1::g.147518::m.147518